MKTLKKYKVTTSNVSEIEKVVGKEVSEFHLEGEETAVQEKEQTAMTRLRKKKNLLLSQKGRSSKEKAVVGKPATSRTVRVDIEKLGFTHESGFRTYYCKRTVLWL